VQVTDSKRSYDAVIVGGGVIGLACAWRAVRRGLDVCVLERSAPGAGASGVAAGMLAPVGEALWGEEELLQLNLESARMYPGFVAELEEATGAPVGYRECGGLHVALDRDEAEELRRRHAFQRELGLGSEWMRAGECRELEPGLSPACAGGVHAPEEAEVDPRRLIAALLDAIREAGAEVVPGADVCQAVIREGRIEGLGTRDGRSWAAESVVLACGAWSGSADWLPPKARPPVRPVKGELLELRGDGNQALCQGIVVTERVYVVPRGDGRVVVGATVSEQGFDMKLTAGGVHELLREAYRVLPEVAELELVDARVGLRPGTPDNLPLIGPGEIDGLILATGHYRNGILLAPLTAERVAATLVGEEVAA
jgi:glycine oxidase